MKYFGISLLLVVLAASTYAKSLNNTATTTSKPENSNDVQKRQNNRCYSNQFQCTSGQCIGKTLLCNGRRDCRDGSDESPVICVKPTTTTQRYPDYPYHPLSNDKDNTNKEALETFSCKLGEFSCISGECIDQNRICDGYGDCKDNSDESPSICPNSSKNNDKNKKNCDASEFRCKNGDCIYAGYKCDGVAQCSDSSDEDWNSCQPNTPQIPASTQSPEPLVPGGNTGGWQQKLTPCRVPPQPNNGRWRLHRSLCDSGVECDAPAGVRSMDPGSYLVYSCNPGFNLNGTRDVLCGPGGKWIHESKCDEIKCHDLSSSTTEAYCVWNNVVVSCEVPAPVGTKAELKCRQGFVQEVTYSQTYKSVTCQTDGTWSPNPIKCVKKPKKVKLVLEGDMIIED